MHVARLGKATDLKRVGVVIDAIVDIVCVFGQVERCKSPMQCDSFADRPWAVDGGLATR